MPSLFFSYSILSLLAFIHSFKVFTLSSWTPLSFSAILKANSSGIADMAINEVIRYVDYLGVSSGGSTSQGYATTAYVDNKIGDINSILDNINGEVI